jgi:hypothetical protein
LSRNHHPRLRRIDVGGEQRDQQHDQRVRRHWRAGATQQADGSGKFEEAGDRHEKTGPGQEWRNHLHKIDPRLRVKVRAGREDEHRGQAEAEGASPRVCIRPPPGESNQSRKKPDAEHYNQGCHRDLLRLKVRPWCAAVLNELAAFDACQNAPDVASGITAV